MLFSSFTFLFAFFPAFFLTYYLVTWISKYIAQKRGLEKVSTLGRNIVLLVFSLFFYAFGEITYVWLLILSILANYVFALCIDVANRENAKLGPKFWLILSIIFNIGLLCIFKYLTLFVNTTNHLFHLQIEVPTIVLPIGISFFTFQIMSYVIDVYKKEVPVQKNPFIVAVYLCAFPQLIAGPIVRYSDVEKELYDRVETFTDTEVGLKRFIIGLSKKVIIANTMAMVVDGIYSYSAEEFGVIGAWIAAFAYTLQIYYDFSGYSDMAIGMGRMMGFHYLENFNYPYSAIGITDFWRRWHMSLSLFFRDYVYIPLGGNRVSKSRWILNMLIVWALTGFWHGASWNFALWGLYYGVLLILEKTFFAKHLQNKKILYRVITLFLIVIGWVIFRVEDFANLGKTLFAMFGGYGIGRGEIGIKNILLRSECGIFFIIIFIIGALCSFANGFVGKMRNVLIGDVLEQTMQKKYVIISEIVCILLLLFSIVMLESGSYNPFIYFRF